MNWTEGSSGGLRIRRRAGDGARVVFLHGLYCDNSYFRGAADMSMLDGLELLSVDLPGFGGSAESPGDAIQGMADALRPLLLDAGARPVLLASHSMANSLAARLAGLARGLVSIEGNMLPAHLALSDRLVALDDDAFALEFARTQRMAEYVLKWATSVTDPELLRSLAGSYGCCSAEVVRRVARAINNDVRSGATVSRFVAAALPMLTIYGTDSGYGGTRTDLERLFPRMAFEAIEGARHFPMLDQPHRTYAALAAFVREVLKTC